MIYTLPKQFDANEWYCLGAILILLILCFLLPRYLSSVMVFLVMLFHSWMARTVDNILATDYPFNFYDTMDTTSYDLFDFIIWTINYPLFGYLFINFYDKWKEKGFRTVSYILVWSVASLLLEWGSVLVGVFQYNNWSLRLSFISYLLIFTLSLTVYWLFRKLLKTNRLR